jgi:hypothetical protein
MLGGGRRSSNVLRPSHPRYDGDALTLGITGNTPTLAYYASAETRCSMHPISLYSLTLERYGEVTAHRAPFPSVNMELIDITCCGSAVPTTQLIMIGNATMLCHST